jgi:hypothetical protein
MSFNIGVPGMGSMGFSTADNSFSKVACHFPWNCNLRNMGCCA